MTFDSADMSRRGKIGAYYKAAKYPADELTHDARRGFMRRFEPTDPSLSDSERQRRTECNLKAHMARLARLSAKARAR